MSLTNIFSDLEAKKRELLLIFSLIFCLSFSVRLISGLRQSIFWQDQARDNYLMHQFHEKGTRLIPYGPKASVGNFYLPPLYYQVNYFFSTITGFRPLVMQWVIVVVESFTPILLFLILDKLSTRKVALSASLIYAVSFHPVFYGSFAWNPNMTPFFTTLTLYAFLHHLRDHSRWSIILGILSIGTAVSFHYQAFVVIPFVALVFILSLRQSLSNFKYWILGGLIFSLSLIPYVSAELQSNWSNGRAMVGYFSNVHSQYFDRVSKPQFVFTFIPAYMERVLMGTNVKGLLLGRGLLLLGALALVHAINKNRRLGILVVYFGVVLLMLRVYKGDKVDYYMSTLFILPSILLAYTINLYRRLSLILLVVFSFMVGFTTFTAQSQRGYQTFISATDYIKSKVPSGEAVVFFHDMELINLFVYGFRYVRPLTLNPKSTNVVDLCLPAKPCDARYRDICWSPLSTTISEIKYKYKYDQQDTSVYPGQFEIVIGKLNPHHDEIKYLDDLSRQTYGSDILLHE